MDRTVYARRDDGQAGHYRTHTVDQNPDRYQILPDPEPDAEAAVVVAEDPTPIYHDYSEEE